MVRKLADDKEQGEKAAKEIEERNIVNFLIGLRTAQGMSQADIALKMGYTQSKISKLESSTDDNLNIGDFDGYARALGLEMTIVLGKHKRTLVDQIGMQLKSLNRLLFRLVTYTEHKDGSIKNGS